VILRMVASATPIFPTAGCTRSSSTTIRFPNFLNDFHGLPITFRVSSLCLAALSGEVRKITVELQAQFAGRAAKRACGTSESAASLMGPKSILTARRASRFRHMT
jgi:hypothetical protein